MGDITTGSFTANGLDFGYLAAGPPDGPLALLLHGFPDSPHTWRHLMPELAAAGHRAVRTHKLDPRRCRRHYRCIHPGRW
jgi:pimeloyl-ACP methyl ester carboxylesterase